MSTSTLAAALDTDSLVAPSTEGPVEAPMEIKVGPRSAPYLADHGFHDMVVLPGSFYVGLALHLERQHANGGAPALVRNASFQSPVILSEGEDAVIGVAVTDHGEGRVEYAFYEAGAGRREAGARQYAARLRVDRNSSPSVPAADTFSLEDLQSRAGGAVDAAGFYQGLRQNGNQYGPGFQKISSIWRAGNESLARLSVTREERAATPHGMHPSLLDSMVQLLGSFAAEQGRTFVLKSIDKVEVLNPDLPDTLWARASLLPGGGSDGKGVSGSVRLLDGSGKACIELSGITLAFLDPAAAEPVAAKVVIASNFTAEPVADSLTFWGDHFGAPVQLEFTPYNQILQQLLDRGSAFRKNRDGVNAILLSLEEWTAGNSRTVPAPAREKAEAAFGARARHVLPNGLEVAHLHRYETEYLYKEIFVDECYGRHGLRYEDGATIVDIGANIGLFSLYVMSRCRNPKIYAFEPAPVVYDLLKANSEAYGSNVQGPNVHALNLGVSDEAKTAALTFYEKSSVFSSFHADESDDREAIKAIVRNMLASEAAVEGDSIDEYVDELIADRLNRKMQDCRMTSVSDFIREHGIDRIHLLKIDAEKSELDIIKGIEDGDWAKIDQIVIEIHDRTREAVDRVEALLISKGYRCAIEHEKLLERSGLFNLYATRYAAAEQPAAVAAAGRVRGAAGALERNINDFCAALASFAQQSAAPVILGVCPRTPKAAADPALSAVLDEAEQALLASVRAIPNVHATGSAAALQGYPVEDYYDAQTHQIGHVPYTPDCYAAIGTVLFRTLAGLKRKPYKVIVLDCDNTLWKGVCGEDGTSGIDLGAPYRELQEFMVGQMSAGMLLCLCSKNAEQDVLEVFDRREDMVLKRSHLVSWRINWDRKSDNIKSLARELSLGLDSFIFVDDNPLDCAEVQANCPGVLTLQLPADSQSFPSFLKHVWAFDHAGATDEDQNRTRMYQQDSERQKFREQTYSLKDFIGELQLRIDIADATEDQVARISQLTFRTNQFNLTTIRRSEGEIRELLQRADAACLAVRVTDRFGDYGLVGVVIYETAADRLKVDSLLLSCRVLGRGVEHAILARLGERALALGKDRVELDLRPTDKNLPAREFVERMGARCGTGSGTSWIFPAGQLASLQYDPDENSQDPSAETAAPATDAPARRPAKASGAFDRTEPLQRIAQGLHRIDLLAKAIEERRVREEPAQESLEAATGTTLEAGLLRIWKRVLGRTRIGMSDNFFEAGGTSLKAVQVIASIKKELNRNLSIVSLFECPTVRLLADRLNASEAPAAEASSAAGAALRGQQRRITIVRRHAAS